MEGLEYLFNQKNLLTNDSRCVSDHTNFYGAASALSMKPTTYRSERETCVISPKERIRSPKSRETKKSKSSLQTERKFRVKFLQSVVGESEWSGCGH